MPHPADGNSECLTQHIRAGERQNTAGRAYGSGRARAQGEGGRERPAESTAWCVHTLLNDAVATSRAQFLRPFEFGQFARVFCVLDGLQNRFRQDSGYEQKCSKLHKVMQVQWKLPKQKDFYVLIYGYFNQNRYRLLSNVSAILGTNADGRRRHDRGADVSNTG